MKFWENLKTAAGKTVNTVVKKTGEVVEDSKVKYAIFDLKNEIEKTYAEIGKEIYLGYKEDRSVAEFIEEKCATIDKFNEEISELQSKLD